jgi:hypothetical protein
MRLPSLTMNHARVIAGAGSFALTVMVFVMMWAKPELADNDLFKSLAQAIVIQGLIGLVMAFLFTGKSAGEDQPQQVEVINPPTEPVPTTEGEER